MFIWILTLHYVADFVLQTHAMASRKSKSWKALHEHVTTYSTVMAAGLIVLYAFYPPANSVFTVRSFNAFSLALVFIGITWVTHFCTDALTSRVSANEFGCALTAYDNENTELFGKRLHDFFLVIGFDQLIHAITLYWTLRFLGFPV